MFDLNAVITPPPVAHLRYRGFTLCHGCSNGRHTEHQPVECQCDLCDPEATS